MLDDKIIKTTINEIRPTMKKILWISGTILILFLTYGNLLAQAPILYSSDVPSAIGTKIVTGNSTDDTVYVDVGTTGGPQNWDFTGCSTPETITQYIVDKSTTPFADSFPTANLVHFHSFGVGSNLYFYYYLSSSEWTFKGLAADQLDTMVQKYQRSTPIFNFPVEYNDVWYCVTYYEFSEYGTTTSYLDSTRYTYDAWGTVAIPLGNFNNCARIKGEVTYIMEERYDEEIVYAETSAYIEYSWHSPGTGYIADVASFFDETDPNFTEAMHFSCLKENLTGVEEKSEPKQDLNFTLMQNYPNPFNPTTSIQYTVNSKQSRTTLTIYNVLGQKVRTLVNEVKLPGEHKVVWDGKDDKGNEVSSGIYFYRLKTKDFCQTKKMLLLR